MGVRFIYDFFNNKFLLKQSLSCISSNSDTVTSFTPNDNLKEIIPDCT